MQSKKTQKRWYMGFHVVTNASTAAQGTHPSSVLHMERSVESVARVTTSRQSTGHHRENR